MPPAYSIGPVPSSDEVEQVRQWIQCLELNEAQDVVVSRLFTPRWPKTCRACRPQAALHCCFLVPLANTGATPEQLTKYREAVTKLMNSLTWTDKVQQIQYATRKS